MSRAEKGQAKDVGGFVGGWLKQGKRKMKTFKVDPWLRLTQTAQVKIS